METLIRPNGSACIKIRNGKMEAVGFAVRRYPTTEAPVADVARSTVRGVE